VVTAVIQDMRRDASNADIDQEVQRIELGRLNAFVTRWPLVVLRLPPYSRALERLAAESPFQMCEIQTEGTA
jgi:hypothetical protein